MSKKFILVKSKITFLNYLFAFAMMIFAFYAPTNFFIENGLIENLEAAALTLAAFFCFIEYKKNRKFKHFFLTCGLLLLIFICRELSWGRVFFTNELGEIPKRKDWIFGTYIYYILTPIFTGILIHAYKTKFVQTTILFIKKAPIMLPDFLLVILMAILSDIAERHMLPSEFNGYFYAIEESAEIAMYFAIALIINSYSRKNLLTDIKE